MDIISVDELASYLRDQSVTQEAAWLVVDLANGIVSDAIGDHAVTPRIRAITFEVAARAFRNPEGYSSETIDDYTYRRDTETRQAGVYLTATELGELRGLTTSVAGAYTVDLGSPPWV